MQPAMPAATKGSVAASTRNEAARLVSPKPFVGAELTPEWCLDAIVGTKSWNRCFCCSAQEINPENVRDQMPVGDKPHEASEPRARCRQFPAIRPGLVGAHFPKIGRASCRER